MQKIMGARTVDIEMDGTIRFQQSNDMVECVVQDIVENYTEAMVLAHNSRVCAKEDVEVSVFLPTERSPIRFRGRITWHSEVEETFRSRKCYIARILITDISRIDQRRFDIIIDQKKAIAGTGYGSRIIS